MTNLSTRLRRHWRAPLFLLTAALLLAPIGCGDDSDSSGNNAGNNDNNVTNNGNNSNNVTNNGNNVTNNGNNVTNNADPVAECQRLCGVVTACQEFLDACGADVAAQANTGCMAACADDADARAQILAVGNLPCATVVPLAIDGFGLAAACGGGNNGGECTADAFEPNNVEEQITELPTSNATHSLSICVDDVDFFRLALPAGTSARLSFLFSHDTADIDVDALIDDGESTYDVSSGSGSDNEYIGIPALDVDATVFFAVFSYDEGGSTPYTLQIEIDPTAAPCNSNSQCGDNEVCLPDASCGTIPPCTEDADCFAFGFGTCDTTTGACVQCSTDDDCFSGVCDATSHECVECRANDDCFGSEVCDTAANSCVECLANTDCASGACDLTTNSCLECDDNADCTDGVCDTTLNECVECLADGDCTDGTCNTEFNRCLPNACAADPFEPNEDLAAAAALPAGDHTGLYICLDEDWFTITVTDADSDIYIAVEFTDDDGDIDVELFEADGTTDVAGSYGTRDNEYVTANGLAAGTYVLRVYGYAGAIAAYSLQLKINDPNFVVCDVDADCAANQECGNRGICLAAGTCQVDRDCSFGAPTCGAANTCVECTKNADCSSDSCDLTTNTCNECDDNADCFSGACNTDTNTCLECATDDDCFFGVCNTDGLCVDCFQDDQCTSGACDVAEGICLECNDNADCGSGICDIDTNSCLECGAATDCETGETCSAAGLCISATCTPDAAEPNDSREAPFALTSLTPSETFNTCDRTQDWYAFAVTAGQEITVDLTFVHANGDIDATLYDPDNGYVSGGSSSTDNEQFGGTAAVSGMYLLNVRGFAGASNDYTMAITLQ